MLQDEEELEEEEELEGVPWLHTSFISMRDWCIVRNSCAKRLSCMCIDDVRAYRFINFSASSVQRGEETDEREQRSRGD